ncbi:MAG: 7-cyano-7-deazaguanine synthase, partial [Planctomycetales bacterium]|nr:7-cyano-7-deazaguanine synthase [Planctomycetales bacterium]
ECTEGEYEERLMELLRESVRLRLRSDVPFGAFLSGGVDSSVIVALMAEQLSEPVKTFSVGFDADGEQDELPYAKQVAERFGCEHHTLLITARDFLEHADRVLWHLDQPIADQATVATFMVARLARQHVKMVLTGEGGDELFAGYARYEGERWSPLFRHLPGLAGMCLRGAASWLPGMRRAKIALNALTLRDEAQRFANWFPMFSDDAKRALLTDVMSEVSAGAAAVFADQLVRCKAKAPLDRMLYTDSKLWLVDYLLLRGDKLTMANSLEARVPLLDHKLVEFAAGLPAAMKLQGKTRKYLLKKAAEKLLPSSVVHRRKQGFPIPIERWLNHEANGMMRDLLCADNLRRRGLFNIAHVERMMQHHASGYGDYSTELWGLMSFEMWMQRFVDSTESVGGSRRVEVASACGTKL